MLAATDRRRVKEQLKFFGCNDRETEIYLQCLQAGVASVQDIAKGLKQNRVTVHSAVEQMIEKGLLFESRRGKRRLIVAEEPVSLLRLYQRKENELHSMRGNLEHIVSLLGPLQATDQSIPTVKCYEGEEGFKRMLEETLAARGEVLVFSYVDLFSKLVGVEYLKNYLKRRAQRGIHTRLIFPKCPFADFVIKTGKENRNTVRLLPPNAHWQSGIFSWNDSLALMSYTQQKLTTTIIENRDIAHFYRTIIFELCWKEAAVPRK
ncbi:MAG: helix-turn-helix domain-containing protein [Patescibacteria group bacterium]